MNGKIARLVRDKGFGFISDEKGVDYFFHHSSVTPTRGFDALTEGMAVSFDAAPGAKGPRAENVRAV